MQLLQAKFCYLSLLHSLTSGCGRGGRGLVISASPVRVVDNTFRELGFGKGANNVLFLEGGCGAYEDYTEGNAGFSKHIWIEDNIFDSLPQGGPALDTGKTAAIQFAGCRPLGSCTPIQRTDGTPRVSYPPCEAGGSTRPPIVKHPYSLYPGPGRITEPGAVLENGTVYQNVTVQGNLLVQGGRLVDVGATESASITNNSLQNVGSASGIRLYSSNGFDVDRIRASNLCQDHSGQTIPCVVEVLS